MPVPDHPDALLTRNQAAAALTEAGLPVAPATLATKATRGGGPPYRLFGRKPLYRWGDALAWAESRLTEPRNSSSEVDIGAADNVGGQS
jgi:alkylation response protein AidB-like acyl-CoA dehydrogenase